MGYDGVRHFWDNKLGQHVDVQPEQNRRRKYLPPVPLEWFGAVADLPGKAVLVALAIQFEAAVQKQKTIELPNRLLKSWGVNPDAKRRGLQALEAAGVVSVKRRSKANPIVTVNKRGAV
jgi:hypothetical protein